MTERETRDKLTIIDFTTSTPSCFHPFFGECMQSDGKFIAFSSFSQFGFSIDLSQFLNASFVLYQDIKHTLKIPSRIYHTGGKNPCSKDSKFINLYLPFSYHAGFSMSTTQIHLLVCNLGICGAF